MVSLYHLECFLEQGLNGRVSYYFPELGLKLVPAGLGVSGRLRRGLYMGELKCCGIISGFAGLSLIAEFLNSCISICVLVRMSWWALNFLLIRFDVCSQLALIILIFALYCCLHCSLSMLSIFFCLLLLQL